MTLLKLHPLLVHFPVSLLLTGTALEVYARFNKDETLTLAAGFNVRLGFWCAVAAGIVGLWEARGLDVRPVARPFFSQHVGCALTAATLFAAALIAESRRPRRGADAVYLVCIVLGAVAVLAAGFYGGELVHRFGVATPSPQPGG